MRLIPAPTAGCHYKTNSSRDHLVALMPKMPSSAPTPNGPILKAKRWCLNTGTPTVLRAASWYTQQNSSSCCMYICQSCINHIPWSFAALQMNRQLRKLASNRASQIPPKLPRRLPQPSEYISSDPQLPLVLGPNACMVAVVLRPRLS